MYIYIYIPPIRTPLIKEMTSLPLSKLIVPLSKLIVTIFASEGVFYEGGKCASV